MSVFLLLPPRHLPDNNLSFDLSFDSLAPRTLVPSLLLLLLIPSSGEKHDFFSGCNAFSRKKMNSLNNSRKITAAISKWPDFHGLISQCLPLPAPHKSQIGGANVPINNAISRGFQNCINRFSTSTRSGAKSRQTFFGLCILLV